MQDKEREEIGRLTYGDGHLRQEGSESKAVPLYTSTSGSGPGGRLPMDFQKVGWGSQSDVWWGHVCLSLLLREERRTWEVSLDKVQKELGLPHSSCLSTLFIFLFVLSSST